MTEVWGILQPDDIPSARRLQSLGLTRAIRRFNEKAVPGMGGLWFAMPLIWSMIGITVARKLGHRPIEAANAIEALAMKVVLGDREGTADPRVRGSRNLPRSGWNFDALRKPGAYVSQPFRQTCTQPLMALGLVEGTSARFNAFRLTEDGERLLVPLSGVHSEIERWVSSAKQADSDILSAILPTTSLPAAVRKDIARRIYGEGPEADRRKTIRDIGKVLTSNDVLDVNPAGLADDHLIDLRGGIAIVRLRKAAIEVLDEVEKHIMRLRDNGLPPILALIGAGLDDKIGDRIAGCVAEAKRAAPHIEAARDPDSLAFLRDCRIADGLLPRLAKHDGVVIVLRDDELAPGPAFGPTTDEDNLSPISGVPELPRIANLLALTDDLSGVRTL